MSKKKTYSSEFKGKAALALGKSPDIFNSDHVPGRAVHM